jgi:transposase
MGVVLMSKRELNRIDVLARLESGRLTPVTAASLLRVSERQVYRLMRRFRDDGPAGMADRRRGRPSNNRLPDVLREQAMALVREHYADFGPTLAAEKLEERHGLRVSRETLRTWMVQARLWLPRAERKHFQQPRHRREHLGELIQIDGCEHRWFEDRGPPCTLLVFVDDATSRLMALGFVPSESTFAYFDVLRRYLETHGRPVAFYSDKHAIFRVNKQDAVGGDGMTQFGRALHELNIDIICANSAPAKGRVERSFGTLQDRLVKEMRLGEVSTLEAANAFLPGFLDSHNARFAKEPRSERDAHRAVPEGITLDDVFAWKEERTVTLNLTLQYDKVLFLLEANAITRPLARKRVTVLDYPDGRLAIRHNGIDLPYRTFDRLQRVDQAAIVENKRLGPVLAYIAERQKELDMNRSKSAPRRRGQADRHIFKVG